MNRNRTRAKRRKTNLDYCYFRELYIFGLIMFRFAINLLAFCG